MTKCNCGRTCLSCGDSAGICPYCNDTIERHISNGENIVCRSDRLKEMLGG